MRARLKDVADLAGVHPATASRALNPLARGRIGPETVDRVAKAAAQLNYAPHRAAQSLATSRTQTIGVIIGDLTVPLFPPILLGIDDVLSDAGYTALIVNTNNDDARERARLISMEARGVDGLIVATSRISNGRFTTSMYTSVAPTVYVVRSPGDSDFPSVLSDDTAGIHEVVDHLHGLGHRRIAHIAGPSDISTGISRLRAYREAMFEHGIPYDGALVTSVERLSIDEGFAATNRLLDQTDLTAIVAFNDSIAYGCYRALRARGLRCPQDVSIVGYTDQLGADLIDPPLTTVSVDLHKMGAEAARMLLQLLRDGEKQTPHSLRVPVSLTVRDSTAPPSTP